MCAAPGGKTTAIAILMKNKGEVVAIDRSHNKVVYYHSLQICALMSIFYDDVVNDASACWSSRTAYVSLYPNF